MLFYSGYNANLYKSESWKKIVSLLHKMKMKRFKIRKKVAGAGVNSIIVIPKLLRGDLPKGTIVELDIKVLEEAWRERK